MTQRPPFIIGDRLAAFLEAGHPIQVGTRDAGNRTAITRSWGCQVQTDRRSVVLFLPRSFNSQAWYNLVDNGVYAAFFINVYTYETYQLKGCGARVLDDTAPYLPVMETFLQEQYRLVDWLGLPETSVTNMLGPREDYAAVHCPVNACFSQTPGATAGRPLKGAGE